MKPIKILSVLSVLVLNLFFAAGLTGAINSFFDANTSLLLVYGGLNIGSFLLSFMPIDLGFNSLLATRVQNMRENMANLDKYELRGSRYGALDLFINQTRNQAGIITPELARKAESSIGKTLQVSVIDDDDSVSISNTRSVTIADSENTSQLVTISFATYSFGFTVVPVLFDNNEISMQRDFNAKMMKYLNKLSETLDSDAITQLMALKTQVFNDKLIYGVEGNTVIAPWAQRENIIGDINPLMGANDYYGQIHMVGNAGMESLIRKLAQKGIYNEVNKQLEYSDKVLHFSNRVSNPEGKYASAYAVQEGSVGLLYRFEREVLHNTKAATGHEWSRINLPMLGIPCGTYYYESVGDFNTIAGAASADMTRVRKQHYGFAVDIGFVVAYNSNIANRPQPIMKIAINTEATDADTTAPSVSGVTSAALTAVTVTFSETMCTDKAGTKITGDVKSLFTIVPATAGASITSATASTDGKSVVFVVVATDLVAADYIKLASALYDAKGNALAADTHITKVNAGATAWVTV